MIQGFSSTLRGMINTEELEKVRAALEDPEGVTKYKFCRSDGKNRANKLSLWNHPGRDVTGVLARTDKIAGTAEQVGVFFSFRIQFYCT